MSSAPSDQATQPDFDPAAANPQPGPAPVLRPYRCGSVQCRGHKPPIFLRESSADPGHPLGPPKCPLCNSENPKHFTRLAVIHLVIEDDNGILKGGQKNWAFLCPGAKAAAQKHLDTKGTPIGGVQQFSQHPSVVTCKDCLDEYAKIPQETSTFE